MIEWLISVRSRAMSPRYQRVFLAIAVPAVALVAFSAFRNVADSGGSFDLRLLALAALVVIPAGQVVSGLEFLLSAAVAGTRVSLIEATRIATIGSAANLMPIPGSPLVRIAAMTGAGTRVRLATGITAAMGGTWLGLGAAITGAGIVLSGRPFLGSTIAGVGILVTGASIIGITRAAEADRFQIAVKVLATETALFLIGALRMWLILHGIGFAATSTDAFFLEASNVVATAAGFAPGGIGLRELLAGITAPLIGIPPSTAVLAAAVNSAMWMAVMAAMAGGLSIFPEFGRRSNDDGNDHPTEINEGSSS